MAHKCKQALRHLPVQVSCSSLFLCLGQLGNQQIARFYVQTTLSMVDGCIIWCNQTSTRCVDSSFCHKQRASKRDPIDAMTMVNKWLLLDGAFIIAAFFSNFLLFLLMGYLYEVKEERREELYSSGLILNIIRTNRHWHHLIANCKQADQEWDQNKGLLSERRHESLYGGSSNIPNFKRRLAIEPRQRYCDIH